MIDLYYQRVNMEHGKLIKTVYMMLLLFSITLPAQNLTFYPETDTMKVLDGCTGPEIICSRNSNGSLDSIIISPGFNTSLQYIDQNGQWRYIDRCYFLISDTLGENEYQLWYYPRGVLPYFQQISFDSTFITYDPIFDLQLLVAQQGIHIDSLFQLFKTEYGLDINDPSINVLPQQIKLYANFPNPFNNATSIKYYLPHTAWVQISVYNLTGQLISVLVNEEQKMGDHFTLWDAGEQDSGIYFMVLRSGDYSTTQKWILVK